MTYPSTTGLETAGPMRLQKFLARAGVCSRRRAERHIREGRVRVNGEVVTKMGTLVDPAADEVAFDGRPVTHREEKVYIALHKPAGVVTSCSHPGETVVTDLCDVPQRIYPVGRLDKASTGLLLLTNDGRIHHRLAHPSFDHEKEYLVTVGKPLSDAALKRLAAGMPVLGSRTRPAEVERLGPRRFRMVLQEGRNRQIRRMVRKVGNRVVKLKRIRMANVNLGDLVPGRWRHLTRAEVADLTRGLEG
jgi:23S rRNA pseudouridine2605 synthase/23S rRNA pseudouridine2604 synthase